MVNFNYKFYSKINQPIIVCKHHSPAEGAIQGYDLHANRFYQ